MGSSLGCQICHSPHLPLPRQLKPTQERGRNGLSTQDGHSWIPGSLSAHLGDKEGVCLILNTGSDGESDGEHLPSYTHPLQGSPPWLCLVSVDERGRTGQVGRQKPPVPAWRGGVVSLSAHNTASSFLFLFSVLLAKQHNVYTSGYYICQNNYTMTNGTSMQSITPAQTGILYPRLPLIPSRVSGVPCVSNHDNPRDARR